jgi:hypothetical protein
MKGTKHKLYQFMYLRQPPSPRKVTYRIFHPAIYLASDGHQQCECNDDKGYDSEEPCFNAIEQEGVQDFDEDAVGKAEEQSPHISNVVAGTVSSSNGVTNRSGTAATLTAAASKLIATITNDVID